MALGENAAEVRVARGILDVHRHERMRRSGSEGQLAADDEAHAVSRRFFVRTNHSVQAVAVGDAEPVVSDLGGAFDDRFRGGRRAQKREIRSGEKLDEAALCHQSIHPLTHALPVETSISTHDIRDSLSLQEAK
jgi:hypothetical protein